MPLGLHLATRLSQHNGSVEELPQRWWTLKAQDIYSLVQGKSGDPQVQGKSGDPQVVLVVKNPPVNAKATGGGGSVPGSGRSPGGGGDNPLQYSCLENPTDRGAWRLTGHRVTQSRTQLKRLGMQRGLDHEPELGRSSKLCLLALG